MSYVIIFPKPTDRPIIFLFSSLPCTSPSDAQALRNLVNTYVSHPNQLQYASRAFVSTFSGESCKFGQASVPDGWTSHFSQHPDLNGKIYFVPAFFIDPSTFTDFADVMDGDFNVRSPYLSPILPKTLTLAFDQWNSGWPIEVTTSFAQQVLSSTSANKSEPHTLLNLATDVAATSPIKANLRTQVNSILDPLQLALSKFIGSTTSDEQHLDSLAALSNNTLQARDGESTKRAYMAAVSPCFFTHYGPNSFNKNVGFFLFMPFFVCLTNRMLCYSLFSCLINTYTRRDGSPLSVYEINLTLSRS